MKNFNRFEALEMGKMMYQSSVRRNEFLKFYFTSPNSQLQNKKCANCMKSLPVGPPEKNFGIGSPRFSLFSIFFHKSKKWIKNLKFLNFPKNPSRGHPKE